MASEPGLLGPSHDLPVNVLRGKEGEGRGTRREGRGGRGKRREGVREEGEGRGGMWERRRINSVYKLKGWRQFLA